MVPMRIIKVLLGSAVQIVHNSGASVQEEANVVCRTTTVMKSQKHKDDLHKVQVDIFYESVTNMIENDTRTESLAKVYLTTKSKFCKATHSHIWLCNIYSLDRRPHTYRRN